MRDLTDHEGVSWLYKAKWGIMFHYLAGTRQARVSSLADWDAIIDGFDVDLVAGQLSSIGAGYLLITAGQNDGYLLSPNASYDRLMAGRPTGGFTDRTPSRDLIADLAAALAKQGIGLMLYATTHIPGDDYSDGGVEWSKVIEEFAVRYGDRVKGWWFDGYYGHDEHLPHIQKAVLTGNPNAVMAFNPGVALAAVGKGEHYTAGEQDLMPKCMDRWIDGEQWHMLTYLSSWWGCNGCTHQWMSVAIPGPRYSDTYASMSVKGIVDRGGVVTLDVPALDNGAIHPDFLPQLELIGQMPFSR